MKLLPALRGCIALTLTVAALGCGQQPKHLVLITVDTLRADRIGAYGYQAAKTPVIDSLAGESIRFEHAYSHASLTKPAVASLLTGQLADQHGVYHNQGKLNPEVRTLAEQLSAHGFESAAFIGNYILRRGYGLERGFANYTDEFVSMELKRPIPENPAGVLVADALEWVAAQAPDRRLFLWLHLLEPHGPYTPPDFERPPRIPGEAALPESRSQSGRNAIPRYQWLGHGRLSEYLLRYDAEITDVDRHLGTLMQGLRENGILEDSVVVFTSDHGEAFGEDDLYCAHGEGLGDVLLRVPLLLRVPGESPAVRNDLVRLIDVMPTLLESLGIESERLPGETILRDRGDRRLISQSVNFRQGRAWRGLRDDGFEIIQEKGGATVIRHTSPTGLGEEKGIPAQVREQLRAELERVSRWHEVGAVRLQPGEQRALRALGYVE
ncbi:MAG: sulfatase [Deltaproteobacteria bacterium]|nr:sulfatase [Deltaproteobacteria bacterium]